MKNQLRKEKIDIMGTVFTGVYSTNLHKRQALKTIKINCWNVNDRFLLSGKSTKYC